MLDQILKSLADLEALQQQAWGMVIARKTLAPTQQKPELDVDKNLQSVTQELGETRIKFDPSLKDAARWALLSVDGSTPTDKMVAAHQQRYAGRSQKLPMEQLPRVREMVPHNTLALMEGGGDKYQLACFVPHIKLPVVGDIAKKLIGRIWFNKEQQFIERVVVQNDQKLSPVPGLSIYELHLGMRFGQHELGECASSEKKVMVMLESELLVVGKKLFKSFNQISHYRYSEHWLP